MKLKDLEFTRQTIDDMVRDAETEYPDECCGFIFGREYENRREITEVTRVANTREERSRRFEISPEDYQKAEMYALKNHLTLLGIYHSHPDHPAIASEYDRSHAMPFFSYVIFSVRNGKVKDLKSWQLNDHQYFMEENIQNNPLNN